MLPFLKIEYLLRFVMVNDVVPEKEKSFNILLNGAGEIMILLEARAGGPENPRLVFDGHNSALLYRSRESAVILENINPEAKTPLQSVSEVLVVELDGDEVAREYMAPLRVVKKSISA